jgi:hypothetical protein
MTQSNVQDQGLSEHPSDTMLRLRQSGEWPAAEKLLRKVKQKYHRKFKKAGGGLSLARRVELSAAAWRAVHDHWPPPADAKPLESLLQYLQTTTSTGKPAPKELPAMTVAAERRFNDIGETTDLVTEVLWVYHNLDANVEAIECPSRGAWSLLAHARSDREAFYRQYVRQAMGELRRKKGDSEEYEYKPSG